MISQIQIFNFQSHRETVLDLHEGVNALVGLTGAGKSVVFKALDWLFRNRPLGDEYRSWWGGDTQVEVVLKEGQKIGRIRTDNDNFYYVDEKEFRAFGNGPPPQPVLELLNLSDVNFQAQADPSFLISNSSGEVARYLNKAAHLDAIDQALTSIAGTLRKEKEDLGREKIDLEQAKTKLVEYDWLPEADEKLERLEKLQSGYLNMIGEAHRLTETVDEYNKVKVDLTGLEEILDCSRETSRLIGLHDEIEKQNSEWEKLASVIDQYEKAGEELARLLPLEKMGPEVKRLMVSSEDAQVRRRKYYDLVNLVSDLEEAGEELDSYSWLPGAYVLEVELEDLRDKIGGIKQNRMNVEGLIFQIDETFISLEKAEIDRVKFKKEFDRLMPNVCPLCEQEIRK